MGRALTSPLQVARIALMSNLAWRLFIEIPRVTGGGYFRMVRGIRNVTASGKLWQAASLEVELPDEDLEGSLGQLSLSLPNVSRIPMAYVELHQELLGQPMTAWLGLEGQADLSPALSWTHRILRVKARERKLSIECGHPAETMMVPSVVFSRLNFAQLLPQGGVTQ